MTKVSTITSNITKWIKSGLTGGIKPANHATILNQIAGKFNLTYEDIDDDFTIPDDTTDTYYTVTATATITIEADSIPIGEEIYIEKTTGTTTIAPGTGVNITGGTTIDNNNDVIALLRKPNSGGTQIILIGNVS